MNSHNPVNSDLGLFDAPEKTIKKSNLRGGQDERE